MESTVYSTIFIKTAVAVELGVNQSWVLKMRFKDDFCKVILQHN